MPITLTDEQWQACYDANLAVALAIAPYRAMIEIDGGPITQLGWYGNSLLRGMQGLLSDMGDANAAAGLATPPPSEPEPAPPEREEWSNTADWEAYALVYKDSKTRVGSRGAVACRTGGGGGMQSFYQGGVLHLFDWDDVKFRPADPVGGHKFTIRAYNLSAQFRRLDIRNTGLVTRDDSGRPTYVAEGHAVYVNPVGDFRLLDSWISHNAGQAYQEATRPHLGNGTVSPRVGLTAIAGTLMRENGYYTDPQTGDMTTNCDRGSDPITINGGGEEHDVALDRNMIETLECPDFNYSGGVANSRGAIKLLADSWTQAREDAAIANGVTEDQGEPPWKASGWAFGDVYVMDNRVRVRNSDRALFFLRGARKAVITGNGFEDLGGRPIKIELDPESQPGSLLPTLKDGTPLQPCGRIEWSGNAGEGEVRYRGVPVGPITGSYVFENGELVA